MQPKILIIGMGGTIAGLAPDAQKPGVYQAGQVSIEALLAGIPGIEKAAGRPLAALQLAQIDSKNMEEAVWHDVLHTCDKALRDPAVAGMVITHGTDTLEETAWLLQLCLAPVSKPIVLTCAMRPANALMPDGPQNLLDAVTVAGACNANGQPLLPAVVAVTGGCEIYSAERVQKTHPHHLMAFGGGEEGPLGWVEGGSVRLRQGSQGGEANALTDPALPAARKQGQSLAAMPPKGVAWPWVEIITSHGGARGTVIDSLVAAGVQGIVVAGTGDGALHQQLEAACARASAQGVTVWRTTRCATGQVAGSGLQPSLQEAGGSRVLAVAASAPKARLAMQLALMGVLDLQAVPHIVQAIAA